jgi:tRNA(fMet)-specific endonuclease VapC
MLWILDTDHVSLFQRNHPFVREYAAKTPASEIFVTIITVEEQLRGRLNRVRRAVSAESLESAYTALQNTVQFFNSVQVLRFDRRASSQYAEFMRQRIRIGTRDLRIAAIALSMGGTVVTRNRKDFSQIAGLEIADWTILPESDE